MKTKAGRLPRARQLESTELVETEAGQFAPQQSQVQVAEVCHRRRRRQRRRLGRDGGRGLWPHLEAPRRRLATVAVGEGLHEVGVQRAAVRARHHVAVVAEEVQPLGRVQHRLEACVTLEQATQQCKHLPRITDLTKSNMGKPITCKCHFLFLFFEKNPVNGIEKCPTLTDH